MTPCPDRETLKRYLVDTLHDSELETIQEHVALCANCRLVVAELAKADNNAGGSHLPENDRKTIPFFPEPLASQPQVLPDRIPLPERYQFIEEIKRGGMGMVVRVRDINIDRPLVVKVILPSKSDADLERRFLFEAHITGQLQHPGIPPVHEIGHLANGSPFFSMKLIAGATLAKLLRERNKKVQNANASTKKKNREASPTVNVPNILAVFHQVAQTLAYAHSQRVIHRDLKPENIMVGEFGEVMVMDWGLAKRLLPNPADERAVATTEAALDQESGVPWESPDAVDALLDSPQKTQSGDVMGTYSYMPPEQARGQIAIIDERSDVFGLGAILCEILTGFPPYRSENEKKDRQKEEIARKANTGDLAEAFERLDRCGAHAELVQLAKNCLAPEITQRPRNAKAVAQRIEMHLAAEQKRLQEERAQRLAAEVKVAEERKRSRIRLALAVVSFLFVLGMSGVGYWYLQIRMETRFRQEMVERDAYAGLAEGEGWRQSVSTRLGHPLKVHELLSDVDGWKAEWDRVHAAWERADKVAAANRDLLSAELAQQLEGLKNQLDADKTNWSIAKELDEIRLEASALVNGKFNVSKAGFKYAKLFDRLGYAMEREDASKLAQGIKQHPLRYVLVAALDHWAQVNDDKDLLPRLLQTARLADPDPWRNEVRDKEYLDLAKLANDVDVSTQSPQVLVLLAYRMRGAEIDTAPMLKRAIIQYPRDYWLYFELALAAKNPGEKTGCWWAALAIRPKSSVAHHNLGNALYASKDPDGAKNHYRKALSNDANFGAAHNGLGVVLYDEKDLAGAIRHFRQAVALNQDTQALKNLGNALQDTNDFDGAIEQYRKALAIEPQNAMVHNDLGVAHYQKKELKAAIASFHKAVSFDAKLAAAHNNLGAALRDQKDLPGAIKHYQKAIALDSKNIDTHYNLGTVLLEGNDLQQAADHFSKALALNPNHANTHYHFGLVYLAKKDSKKASDHFRTAIKLDPTYVSAHNNLGSLLHENGDLEGAIKHYREALRINDNHANAHNNLGTALAEKNEIPMAIVHFRKALEIDPSHVNARQNLAKALKLNMDQ